MTDPTIPALLPGLHRVTKRPRAGGVVQYWYAWRGGGPLIATVKAASDRALPAAVAAALPAAIARYNAERSPAQDRTAADGRFLYGLITRYLIAMETDDSLADRTKSDRRKYLDRVRAAHGELETKALESKRARTMLIDWRDTMAATPKTADELLGALSAVLAWAVGRGELAGNCLEDFPRIYHVNRAEIIWEPHHMAALLSAADPEFALAVRLAALTALRESDLIGLPWSAVGKDAIVWQTAKSNRKRTVVVPITPALRQLLAEIPKVATTVLASRRKRPWKVNGIAAGLRRARLAVLAHARKVHGPDAQSPIAGLRFHDLRGTAATNFLLAGLDILDVARILGWKPDRVGEIATRYVSGQAMGLAMVRKLKQNAPPTPAVNSGVNPARKRTPKGH